MNHTNAIETHAVERYLLGELSEADVETFEEHFFDCTACAEDVRDGMRFMEGGREVAREKIAPLAPSAPLAPVVSIEERRHRRIGWMQLTAAAVLAVGIAVPQFVQKDDDLHMQPLRSISSSRSAAERLKAGQRYAFGFDILDDGYVSFESEIRIADGKVIRQKHPLVADAATNSVLIRTPELPVGACELSIIGVRGDGNRSVIEKQAFNVVP